MHKKACTTIVLATLGLGLSMVFARAARAERLDETVKEQGQIIEQLREELSQMRAQQMRSDDRVRALEDELAHAQSTGAVASVTRGYVDRRIEAFETAPQSRLFLSGYGSARYHDITKDADGTGRGASTFSLRFNPIFHFAMTDRLHFNAELELSLGKERKIEDVTLDAGPPPVLDVEFETETETELELEYATIDYLLTDWLSFTAGKFLLPFNIFSVRLHPDWINKLASAPPIYGGHGEVGLIPVLSDVGMMLSGGTTLWNEDSKINYFLYAVNGPTMEMLAGGAGGPLTGDLEAELLGLQFENVPDDNNNKSVGGRVGFLPIPNLEVGTSFLTGRTRGSPGRFNLAGADLSYWWRGLDVRGEFVRVSRNRSGSNPEAWGYWLQLAYRLRHHFSETRGFQGVLGRFEPVIRWGEIDDLQPRNREQLAFGLNYWIYESVPLKFTYELNGGALKDDRFLAQFAYGF